LTSSPSYQDSEKQLIFPELEEEKDNIEIGKKDNEKFDLFQKKIVINQKSKNEDIKRNKSNYFASTENGSNNHQYSKIGVSNNGKQDIKQSNQFEFNRSEIMPNQKNYQWKSFKESPKKDSKSPPHNYQKERKNSMATNVQNHLNEANHLSMVSESSKKFNPSLAIKDTLIASPNSKYSMNNKTKPSSPVTKLENLTKKSNSPKLFSSICSSKNFSPVKKEAKQVTSKYNTMKHVKLKLNNS